jgi:hypothetical protein
MTELRHPHTFDTLHNDRVEAMVRMATELGQPALSGLIQFENQPAETLAGMTHEGKFAYLTSKDEPVKLLSIDLSPNGDDGGFGPATHDGQLRITENMANDQGKASEDIRTYTIPSDYRPNQGPKFKADAWDADRAEMPIYDIGTADPATLPKDMKQLYAQFGRKLSIVEDREPGSATEPATLEDILGVTSGKDSPAPVASSRYLEGERHGKTEVMGVDTETARDMRVALDYELASEVNDQGDQAARAAANGLRSRFMSSDTRAARSLQAAADARAEALRQLDVDAISERLRNNH